MELLDAHGDMNKIDHQVELNNTLKDLAKDAAREIYEEAYNLVNDMWIPNGYDVILDDEYAFGTAIDDFVRHLANELHSIRLEQNSQHYG